MKKTIKTIIILLNMLLIFPSICYAQTNQEEIELTPNDDNVVAEIVSLDSCIDGDTAKFRTISDEVIKARFLAIDTPETVHPTKGEEPFGKDASNFTCTMLSSAKEIKLEYDNNSNNEDNYGRKLVWVFVDDILLQDLLVSRGYAEVAYLYGDYKYTSLLQENEAIAKSNKLGIWSLDDVEEKSEKKENKDYSKGFFEKLLDSLLGKIFDFIDDLLEKILKMIEDML